MSAPRKVPTSALAALSMASVEAIGLKSPPDSDAAAPTPQTPSSAQPKDTVHPEAVAIWAASVGSMSREQRNLFVGEMPDGDLLKYATVLEKIMTDKSEASQALKVAKRIAPLVHLFEATKPFSEALNSVYPPAGMILGGISFLLSTSKRAVDYQEALNAFLESTVDRLKILEGYKSAIRLTKDAQEALANIYGEIVQFLARISKTFMKSERRFRHGLKLFARSQLNTFDAEFQGVKERMKSHVDNFQLAASFQSQVDSKRNHGKTHEKLDNIDRDRKAMEARDQVTQRMKLLEWISRDSSYHDTQDQKLGERLEGTGNWLLNHKLFQSWKEAGTSQLLWVRGKAGSGKSHLAACAIDDLEKSCKQHTHSGGKKARALAYFYCSAKSTQHQDQRGDASSSPSELAVLLLGSISRQLYEQLPAEENVDFILQSHKDRPSNRLGREKTKDGIRNILMKFTRAFIVVDGLDEWSGLPGEDFVNLCEFLQSLTTLGSKSIISVAIFSRPKQPTLESALSDSVKMVVDDGSNADDINLFINKRTSDLMKSSPVSEQIRTGLANRADGMFLWASLVINALKSKRTPKQMQQTLKETPSDLEAAYSTSLQRIMAQEPSRRELGLNALLWVSNSLKPLNERELVEALSFQPGMRSIENDDRVYGENIISDCADLLIVRQGHYELLHSSLKDYLRKTDHANSSLPEAMRSMQRQANTLLGRRCLEYLQLEEFQEVPVDTAQDFEQKLQNYPLLKHAACNWGDYLRHSYSTENPGDCSFECSSLRNPKTRNFVTQIRRACFGWDKKVLFPCPGKVQPLHVIAKFGLERLLARFPESVSQIAMADGFGIYPIDYARERTMIKWILDHRIINTQPTDGADVGRSRHSTPWYSKPPIIHAAWMDWDDIVSRLIKEGCDKDEKNTSSETALHAAGLAGSLASVEVLIKEGADINATDLIGRTPLMNAIQNNHLSLFKLLLGNGADAGLPRSDGRTVLHQLAFKEEEWTSLTPLLCAGGASLEAKEEDGVTPLLMAAHADNAAALQAFWDQGANISATDMNGRNILHICAMHGCYRAMDLLLKCSGPLRAILSDLARGKDSWGQSPLHRAVEYGPLRMAEVLLFSELPSMDFRDTDGWWPIHFAARRGALKVVRALVELDAENANLTTGETSQTPLYIAAEEGYTHVVEYLLSIGADADMVDTDTSQTPLLRAIIFHNTATAVALLSHGANPSLSDTDGDAALEFAAIYGNEVLVRLLLDTASRYPISQHQRLRALHFAVRYQHVEVVDLLLPSPEDFGFLSGIEKSSCGTNAVFGGNIDTLELLASLCPSLSHNIGDIGENLIHVAALRGHTQIIGYLCKQGLDLEKEDNSGQTPLILAARAGSTSALLALCHEGANVTHIDSFERTALHWAAFSHCEDGIKLLITEGADPYARDQAGLLAFDYLDSAQLATVTAKHAINLSPHSTNENRPQRAIASIARRILQLDLPDATGQRIDCMVVLRDIFVKFQAFKETVLVARELTSSEATCEMCYGTIKGSWSLCKACYTTFVCSSCRTSFFTTAGISRLPRRFSGIHTQEQKIRPVLRALFHDANLGANTVLEILETHGAFGMTFTRLSDLHKAWQTAHRLEEEIESQFQNAPGWKLICILDDLRTYQADMQKGPEDADPDEFAPKRSLDTINALTYRLRNLLIWDHFPGQGFAEFRCTGHEYLDVPTVEELPEEEKAFFDEEGYLNASFFEMLEKKYSTGEDADKITGGGAPDPVTLVDSDHEDLRTSSAENTFNSPEKPLGRDLNDDSSDLFEDALEEQPSRSEQVAGQDSADSSDDDASSDISATTEVGEDLLIFEDRATGRIWKECNPDFDFDHFRETLLGRMKELGPDDGGREMRRKKVVLETAWALAQAFAFEDETHFPTLAEYLN